MDAMKLGVNVSIDENNSIRVLEQDKFRDSENLKTECIEFLKKIVNFNENVESLITLLDEQGSKIEKEKLRMIGARIKCSQVESDDGQILKEEQALRTTIRERKLEIERLKAEFESLSRVEGDQKALIDKLSNNETN